MSDIQLTFYNRSNDANNSSVVIFQKNVATTFDELSVAWKVIENCAQNNYHPFVFPMGMYIRSSDSYGNFTPELPSHNGQLFHMTKSSSGNTLEYKSAGTSSKEVQLQNDLERGAINASIFKDGRLLARKTNIAPAQKAVFEFKPTVYIGVASQVTEGQVMNSAIISSINTEISLLGLKSADIVMTGGGPGPDSEPFQFSLENVVMG